MYLVYACFWGRLFSVCTFDCLVVLPSSVVFSLLSSRSPKISPVLPKPMLLLFLPTYVSVLHLLVSPPSSFFSVLFSLLLSFLPLCVSASLFCVLPRLPPRSKFFSHPTLFLPATALSTSIFAWFPCTVLSHFVVVSSLCIVLPALCTCF